MLSVIIEANRENEALARTLASLVSAAIEGVVREVIVCDPHDNAEIRSIADHTGCLYLENAKAFAGIQRMKSEWALLLEPGARLLDGWSEVAAAHMETSTRPACFTLLSSSRKSFFTRLLSNKNYLEQGALLRHEHSLTHKDRKAADLVKLTGRLTLLDAQIVPAPRLSHSE